MAGLLAALFAIGVAIFGFYLYSPVPEGAMGQDWPVLCIIGTSGKAFKLPMSILHSLGLDAWMVKFMRFQMGLLSLVARDGKGGAVEFSDDSYAGVPVRVYTPQHRKGNGAVLYMHGGGWAIGSIENAHSVMLQLARKLQRVVVSIEYRLAPEHPYPAAPDDCEIAVRHFLEKAYSGVQVDPTKVVVAGDSAGGNLAAVVANRLNENPAGHQLKAQILIYPVTQATDFQLASYLQGHAIEMAGNATMLTTQQMAMFFLWYFGLPAKYLRVILANQHVHESLSNQPQFKLSGSIAIPAEFKNSPIKNAENIDLSALKYGLKDEDINFVKQFLKDKLFNPDINPLYYENFNGLPPAYVTTCGFDVLRDEGIMYTNRLKEARVPTVWKHYPTAIHGTFYLINTKLGKQHIADLVDYLSDII